MKKNSLLILLLALSLASCNKYEPLHFERTPYEGKELRTDGFWYHVQYSQYLESPGMNVYYLYRDGIFLWAATAYTANPTEVTIDSIYRSEYSFQKQTDWGVFRVEDGTLKWSQWFWLNPAPGQAFLSTFEIINDTCFKREVEGEEDYYYFYPFDYKPDSTIARQWIP